MTVTIGSVLKKAGPAVPYIADDADIKGGFHCVSSIAERDAIPLGGRRPGMVVRVIDANGTKNWTLPSNSIANTAWYEDTSFGAGAGGTGAYIPTAGGDLTGALVVKDTGSIDLNGKAKIAPVGEDVVYTSEVPLHLLAFNNGTENTVEIDVIQGQITVKKEVALASDSRLKENVETVPDSLAITKRLRGVLFDWKSTGEKSMGVIAQELQEVLPFLSKESSDGTLSVMYTALIGLLIENIKELDAKVEAQAQLLAKLGIS
jgi:hypothetical protein